MGQLSWRLNNLVDSSWLTPAHKLGQLQHYNQRFINIKVTNSGRKTIIPYIHKQML